MLSESHKQAINKIQYIINSLKISQKKEKLREKDNQRKFSSLYTEAFNKIVIKFPQLYLEKNWKFYDTVNYEFYTLTNNYKSWNNDQDKTIETIFPFIIKHSTFYSIKINDKNINFFNVPEFRKQILTLLHILYNRLKNKKRGHTKDDNSYIEKNKEFYKTICERMEMQQFLLDAHKESTNANSCT